MTFLNSLLNNSKEHDDPFKHWELNEPLSEEAIQEIIKEKKIRMDFENITNLPWIEIDFKNNKS